MKRYTIAGALVAASLFLAACAPGGGSQEPVETTTVERGSLAVAVSGNGTVEPLDLAEVNFGVTGTVAHVMVDEGQLVEANQDLAELDPRDLDQTVRQSEANVQTAEAQLEQAKSGNATEQDLQAQQAALDSAQANLDKARTGGVTAADIANAEAGVRNAQAGLVRAQTGNITQADIANAEAAVRSAEAGLQRARTGNITPADIANAEAAVRSAEAQYQKASKGPSPDQVSAAQTRLDQAKQSLQKTASAASTAKSNAEQSLAQQADAVRLAQEAYSKAFWDNDKAQNGIDPQTGQQFKDINLDEDIQKQTYAQALRDAELRLSQAQSQQEQARLALENAKQAEINDVATAQTQVDDAQVALDELLKGPKPEDVATAQASLDQARSQLQKLQAGGTPADIATAQASLDQARAQLAKLRQGGTAADIAGARAQVDQANAQLAKLQQGGSTADVAVAQASVDQANAQFEKLTSPAAPSDIEIAEAGVTQAVSQLEAAKLNRDKATLRAPFAGIVTVVTINPGDIASGAGGAEGAAVTIVDASKLHIDVNISESDVAQVEEGQTALVQIEALGDEQIPGRVSYIAPASTVVQDVTTYLVRIDVDEEGERVRVGMTASVEIGVEERENVLLIPLSAVRSSGSKRFVRLQSGNDFVDQEVKLGISNDVEVEVTDGLKEGDVIATLAVDPEQ